MCINIFSFCSKGYSKTLIHNRWKRNKFHYLTATLTIASWIANVRYSQYLRKFWKPAEMLNCQDLVFSFNFQFHHQRLVKILQLNYQLELPFSLNFKTGLRVALHKYARIRVFTDPDSPVEGQNRRSVLIRENTGQWKPTFSHTSCSAVLDEQLTDDDDIHRCKFKITCNSYR